VGHGRVVGFQLVLINPAPSVPAVTPSITVRAQGPQ
jgi:hypothetical protein